MKKVNLLSRAEMRNVLGGVEDGGEGAVTCKFKYKETSSSSWSNWSEATSYSFGDCNSWCLTFISQGSVANCAYETIGSSV